jgi:hypothetical protein
MKLYYELTLVEEELLHDHSAWQSDGGLTVCMIMQPGSLPVLHDNAAWHILRISHLKILFLLTSFAAWPWRQWRCNSYRLLATAFAV